MKKLIDYLIDGRIRSLAIIGLAKNAGKTVTFNTIVREATERGFKLALLSYGRDGEDVDAITRQKKPKIYIPPETVFITARKAYEKSGLEVDYISRTGINTLLGEVNLYRTQKKGGFVELVGINSSQKLKKIKNLISREIDLILVDGALDRRSSAVPALTEGLVLATGAVIGNTADLVVDRTKNEIRKLTLPGIEDLLLKSFAEKLLFSDRGGIVSQEDELVPLASRTTFDIINEIREKRLLNPRALLLTGALVDSFAEELIYALKIRNCNLVIKDGTRVFLNQRNLKLLQKYNLALQVLHQIKVIAVTANPLSPYGIKLSSGELVEKLRAGLKDIPVYDVLGEEYLSDS